MKLKRAQNGAELLVAVSGRLDTTTAPQLEAELHELAGITALILDFSDLDYISSAGLRVLLSTQKTMGRQGTFVIRHPNESVQEVFDITGFSDVLTIEK